MKYNFTMVKRLKSLLYKKTKGNPYFKKKLIYSIQNEIQNPSKKAYGKMRFNIQKYPLQVNISRMYLFHLVL